MKTIELPKKVRDFFTGKNRIRLIVILGMCGMLLIMLSEILPSDKTEEVQSDETAQSTSDETEIYKAQTEKELTELLSQINGVGECTVMVTVEGTTEYVYAENLTKYIDENETSSSEKYENEIVMVEKEGEKQALVKKIIKPQINGVAVVCEGGGDIKINERIIRTVATALGISSSKIIVEQKS
jgi:stage III sporulation protein AG